MHVVLLTCSLYCKMSTHHVNTQQDMTDHIPTVARLCNLWLVWESSKYYIFRVCVAFGNQYLWPVWQYHIFPHLVNSTIF